MSRRPFIKDFPLFPFIYYMYISFFFTSDLSINFWQFGEELCLSWFVIHVVTGLVNHWPKSTCYSKRELKENMKTNWKGSVNLTLIFEYIWISLVSGIKLRFGENLHVRVFTKSHLILASYTSHFENEILVFSQNSSQNLSLLCMIFEASQSSLNYNTSN